MKCNSKKVRDYKNRVAYEKEKEEEQKYINSLSDEDKEKYYAKQREFVKRGANFFAQLMGMSAGLGINDPYSKLNMKQ